LQEKDISYRQLVLSLETPKSWKNTPITAMVLAAARHYLASSEDRPRYLGNADQFAPSGGSRYRLLAG
jgi:hypothetical protein